MKTTNHPSNLVPSNRSNRTCKGSRAWAPLLTAVFIVISSPTARAVDYSNWLKNISAAGDPDSLYIHNCVKVAVSGNYVHVAWLGTKKDWSDGAIFHTRSADGGKTFSIPRILTSGLGQSQESFPPHFNNFAVDGPYVHLVYVTGWPRKFEYLRSTDNGATFAPAKTLHTGYFSYTAHLAAEGGKLAIAWSGVGTDAPQPKWLNCTYSNKGGASFNTTQMASSIISPYDYSVVDSVRSGNYLYVLTQTIDWNNSGSTARIFLWASWDGGATFKTPVKVTVPADDTNDYARTLHSAHYSPNLVASGLTVNITWVNIDIQSSSDFLWTAPTLRTRRSTDGGLTLRAPVTLHTFPPGYSTGANCGLETIAGSGNNLYITSVLGDTPAGTYTWRSTDAGATWSSARQISTGGWWPLTRVDPSNSAIIHTVNSAYFLSRDSGATFDGGVNPHLAFGNWDAPQMAVDASGAVHYAAPSGGPYTNEIFYRRIAAPLSPAATEKSLTLVRDASGTRSDNMQVAARPQLNFTTAMTLEFWARRDTDDTNTPYFEPMVGKKRLLGDESYGIGAWADSQVYARLVTDRSASNYSGDWIGSGVSMAKGEWYHVALTYDAGLAADNIKLFVNGALCGRANLQGSILADTIDSPLMIGNNSGGVGGFSIDELRLWNKPLTQTDIAARMTRPLAGSESGLVAYYNFNGTTKDITGHGHDGILMYRESYTTPGAIAPAKPEIVVAQPSNRNLVDGKTKNRFGTVTVGKKGTAKTFTIRNKGTAPLTRLSILKAGKQKKDFLVGKLSKSSLAPGGKATFKVAFQPKAGGTRKCVLKLASNDANENPFDIKLTGMGRTR